MRWSLARLEHYAGSGYTPPIRSARQRLAMVKEPAACDRDPVSCREAVRQGQFIRQVDSAHYPIPSILNMALAAAEIVAVFALLGAASRTRSLWETLLCAIAFAFLMQLGFGLAHEAAHGKLHPRPHVNEGFGIFLYSLFPGSYHLFAIAHLIHHQRNRSDAELEDYILPTETPWLKRVTYYLLLCGLFWILTPPAVLAIALWPGNSIRMPAPAWDAGVSSRYMQFLNSVSPWRVRRDLLLTTAIWTAAWLLLHFRLSHLAVCYAAFAFCWASQQYIYHVRTPRHVVLGALDLHLWRPFQLLYLNFNYHLTHHVAAGVPWIYLPRIAAEPPARGFLATYLQQWRPPEPLEKAWPPGFQASGPLPPQGEAVIAGRPREPDV
jgi:fatty acid desaturase